MAAGLGSPKPQEGWTPVGIGVAATPLSISHLQRMVFACLLLQSFPALPCSALQLGELHFPGSFALWFPGGLVDGKRWQAGGGGADPRHFSLSLLQAASLPMAGLLRCSSSQRMTPSSRSPVLLDRSDYVSHFCWVAPILDTDNTASSPCLSTLRTAVSLRCC